MALTIGLTGGIASGKSLVQGSFEALGVPVLDADQVAREVVAPGSSGLAAIAETFGPEFLLASGELDRRRLRRHVFNNVEALRALERITHPRMRVRMQQWRDAQHAPYIMLSVAILVEAKMQDLIDRVLLVDAPTELQLARLVQRDGVDEALARSMLAAQADRATRLAAADDVLSNSADIASTRAAVSELHRYYLQLAASGQHRAVGLRLPHQVKSVTI